MERRRIVSNPTDRLMLVFTELEAQDYWLRPAESVELRAEVEEPDDDFEIEDNGEGITIWPSRGMGYISVHAGDELLYCGYQRPSGWAESGSAPTRFMAKTWIFYVQALFFGGLSAFSLIFGSLFLFRLMNDANGAPATDAGIALCAMSMPLLLVFALAVYNLRARRQPLLRICREGIEIVQIGSSSLDGIPLIPGLIRLTWLILSTQGFRKRVVRIPWRCFQDVWVSGPPMSRRLTIVASPSLTIAEELPAGSFPADQVVLPEVTFNTPLDQIAEAINLNVNSSITPTHLPSWDKAESAAD